MAASTAKTVEEYFASLPAERREVVRAVRAVVKKHLPKGYAEGMHYGMIYYHIPLSRFPETYNGQPLCYAGLAAQKNHFALYLMGAYGEPGSAARLKEGFARAGKKLDMGKSCLRFKRVEDLALDAIGESIASLSPDAYIALYERSRLKTKAGARKAGAKSSPRKA
jgi:Domain of unknown function (DU1801)